MAIVLLCVNVRTRLPVYNTAWGVVGINDSILCVWCILVCVYVCMYCSWFLVHFYNSLCVHIHVYDCMYICNIMCMYINHALKLSA